MLTTPTVINLSTSTPAAPSGSQNVAFQADTNNPRNVSANVPLATPSAAGLVQLASDLGGSANVPRVAGLQGVPISATTPSSGQVLTNVSGQWGPRAPLFDVNWQNWTPAFSASGSMTVNSVTVSDAQYVQLGPFIFFKIYWQCVLAGSASFEAFATLPVTPTGFTSIWVCQILPAGASQWSLGVGFTTPQGTPNNALRFRLNGGANFTLGATFFSAEGFYRWT